MKGERRQTSLLDLIRRIAQYLIYFKNLIGFANIAEETQFFKVFFSEYNLS